MHRSSWEQSTPVAPTTLAGRGGVGNRISDSNVVIASRILALEPVAVGHRLLVGMPICANIARTQKKKDVSGPITVRRARAALVTSAQLTATSPKLGRTRARFEAASFPTGSQRVIRAQD